MSPRFRTCTLLLMTPWIVLLAATVLFALALASGRQRHPPLPPGHDGERQLAELHALTVTAPAKTGPDCPRRPVPPRRRP
jgi:hypothetical protein